MPNEVNMIFDIFISRIYHSQLLPITMNKDKNKGEMICWNFFYFIELCLVIPQCFKDNSTRIWCFM